MSTSRKPRSRAIAPPAERPRPLRSRPRLRRLACGPPEEVADGVWLLRGGLLRTMNVYLVRDPERGGAVVFDAGEKGMASCALPPRRRRAGPGFRRSRLLAHGPELPLDVRLLHGFTHRYVWDGGPVHIDGTVREGEVVAGFEVIDLSGHAPGLIGPWRERDRVALVSDCFYMNDMHGRPKPPSVPLDAYNLDTAAAA
jgi:glyoxylase-like metal-dependent hydrolase (beta-lactamase superfamily II)